MKGSWPIPGGGRGETGCGPGWMKTEHTSSKVFRDQEETLGGSAQSCAGDSSTGTRGPGLGGLWLCCHDLKSLHFQGQRLFAFILHWAPHIL